MDIRNELEQLRDEKYREFGLSLLPKKSLCADSLLQVPICRLKSI